MNTQLKEPGSVGTRVVSTARDLEQFGIDFLTSEACAYHQRVLCDVNEDGKLLLQDFFGYPEINLAPPLNSRVNDKPSVGSLMLHRSLGTALAKFAAFHTGALAYREQEDESIVIIYSEERLQQYLKAKYEVQLNPTHSTNQPFDGSRNVHACTGRTL